MSPRSILIVVLAMSGSFVTILAVVGHIASGEGGGRRTVRRPDVVTVAPPVLRAPEAATRRRAREVLVTDTVASATPDVPSSFVPLSPPPSPPPAEVTPADPDVAHMARVAGTRLQGVEAALSRQVQVLKQSRDEMLDDFAGHLAAMPVTEATLALKPLDDETAALTLKRLAPARRSAILRALPNDRRGALQKRLGTASR